MSFERDLDVYLRARITLIVLVTPEEERALQTVKAVCERSGRPCLTWDVADNFQPLTNVTSPLPSAKDALAALEKIDKSEDEALFVLKDFHEAWGNAQHKRKLRSVAQRLKFTKKSILITTPTAKIPDELHDEAVIVDFPPPSAVELEAVLTRLAKAPGVKVNLTKLGREKLVQAALGLTAAQAQRVFAKAIVGDGVLDDRDIVMVTEEKKQIIRESKALEFYPVTKTIEDVGGLEILKQWLRLRERAFTQEARDYGLPAPKGIALIGIPGTGKSLTAKMIGGLWRLPLLRLDVGALYGSLMGESEERARRALQLAETVAPCVLWLEEVEKSLAHGDFDSGTSTRVFGTILTWMQEKTAPCFVVACMTGATVVARPDGTLPTLADAGLGPVWSADFAQGKLVEAPTDLRVNPLSKQLVEVHTSGTYLECTPNHPLFIPRSDGTIDTVPAKAVQPGDYVAAALQLPEPTSRDLPLDLPPLAPQAKSVSLPRFLDEDTAYWLGYLTGDGGVARLTSCHPQRLQWSELDAGMVAIYGVVTQKVFGKALKVYSRKTARGFYLALDSSSIGRWIEQNFPETIRPHGPNRSVPQLICRSPNRIVGNYLAGLFDAESSVSRGRIKFITTSYVLAQQVSLLLRRLEIHASFERRKPFRTSRTRRKIYRLTISQPQAILRYQEQVGFRHPAKARKLGALMKHLEDAPIWLRETGILGIPVPGEYISAILSAHRLPASLLPYYNDRKQPGLSISRQLFRVWLRILEELAGQELLPLRVLLAFRWERVKSTRTVKRVERVFDLRVPGYHNYVAGGLIVHNTANDISRLPPEVLRKGRFDEIFFLDLPTQQERHAIFAIHLTKRNRLVQDFDLEQLARAAEGYVGAEIEQAVIDAMYVGFNEGREFTTDDILRALKRQVPLSVSQREIIDELRAWLAEGRAQSASLPG